jgi:hypothetical protein
VVAQNVGYVFDKKTLMPVVFAIIWVEDGDFGTTSDINGYFHFNIDLRNKTVVVSSIGYEKLLVKVDTTILNIYLSPKVYDLPEIVIRPKKIFEKTWITYRKSQLKSFVFPNAPLIYATYLPYQEEAGETIFIKSIKFETFSKIKSCFNLRFFRVSKNGEPGEDILSENLIINVKKGKMSCLVNNFMNRQIRVPKEGIFIGFEFLVIKENEYSVKALNSETKKKENIVLYMPGFGTFYEIGSAPLWLYRKGKWEQFLGKTLGGTTLKGRNQCFAIEVKVTN